MAQHDETDVDAERRALRDALGSPPVDDQRPKPQSDAPVRRRVERPTLEAADPVPAPARRDDDAIITQITALGSFMTRRMDEVDHRLDELADLLESLLSSLLEFLLANLPDGDAAAAHGNGDQPMPQQSDQVSLSDPR